MNKKERLKKQAQKQLAEKKRTEIAEQAEIKQHKESRKLKKYRSSKQSEKLHAKEPKYYLYLKLLQLVPFGYSVVFWGGVLVIGILGNMINQYEFSQVSNATAVYIIVSAVVLALSFVLSIFRKYIFAFPAALVGTVIYFNAARSFIEPITKYLDEKAVSEELLELDKLWMERCYPVWVFALLSFALLADSVVRFLIKRKIEKDKRNNAPVRSIVSD